MTNARSKEWLAAHDHRRTEDDYDRWRERHFEYLHRRMETEIAGLAKGIHPSATGAMIAGVTGLSSSTVNRLIKKQVIGVRGPTLRTYLALKAMGRSSS